MKYSQRAGREVPVYRIVWYGDKGYVTYPNPFNESRKVYQDFVNVGVCYRVK